MKLGAVFLSLFLQAAIPRPSPILVTPSPTAVSDLNSSAKQNLEIEKLRFEIDALRREQSRSSISDFKDVGAFLQSIATVISFAVGAWWIYSQYVRGQGRYPNIEFTVDISVIGQQNGMRILELIAYVENKGKAQHKMTKFTFDLNGIKRDGSFVKDSRWGDQINFPEDLAKGSFMPKQSKFSFVDPGVKSKYSYVTSVDEDISFLILHSSFEYTERGKTGHTAERTIQVPEVKTFPEGGNLV